MGEFEAIGDAVTGGLLARAVEPAAGEPGPDGHTHEKCCLNCGILLTGPFCSACGQKSHIHRSLRAFAGDFVASLTNFAGKFWRTLPMLAWRPGEMTRRYIAGERAKFISPVALYLFTVFAMFAVLNFTGALTPDAESFKADLQEEIAADPRARARLEQERRNPATPPEELARPTDRQAQRGHCRRREDCHRRGVRHHEDGPRYPRMGRAAGRKCDQEPGGLVLKGAGCGVEV